MFVRQIKDFLLRLFTMIYGLFHPLKKQILFFSYNGLYADSGREISEQMHVLFPEYELVWLLKDKIDNYNIIPTYIKREFIKNKLTFYKQLAKSFCLVSNKGFTSNIHKRKKVVEQYKKRLSNIKGIKLCKEQEDVKHNYGYFPVVFDNYKYTRDEIFEKLKAQNIIARKYFYPLTSEFECYKNLPIIKKYKTPVAKYISERILTLSLYAALSLQNVNKICDTIMK